MVGGRVVTVTGARGGTGASTIAANLAWHFGVEARRHTVLLDADLHRGTAAMLLGAKIGPGLRTVLEAPDRIDELFVERAAQPVSKRLHVLAGEEKLTETVTYTPDAAARLLDALRRRYNFVVIDVPWSALPLHRDLLMMAHQRVLVMDPTLASVRDVLRLMALPNGPWQPGRGVLVLNRDGLPGGLNRRQLEEGLKMRPTSSSPICPRSSAMPPAWASRRWRCAAGFAAACCMLAREVAFVRLLDSGIAGSAPANGARGRLRRLLRSEIMSVTAPQLRPAQRAGRAGRRRCAPDAPGRRNRRRPGARPAGADHATADGVPGATRSRLDRQHAARTGRCWKWSGCCGRSRPRGASN